MFDNKGIFDNIINGVPVRIETTGTQEIIISMKTWLQQFDQTVFVNEYEQQHNTKLTLCVGMLPYDKRFLLAGKLESDSHLTFKVTNGANGANGDSS